MGPMSQLHYFFDTDREIHSWREIAACTDRADVDFFAVADAAVARAKAVCAGCSVAVDCLEFAVETNQPDGIWGGMTVNERRRVRRQWLEELRRAS